MSTHKRSSIWLRAAGAIAIATLAVSTVSISAAGASDACGELSFAFPGTRLLNDGISNNAGPFPADIPAGTYTVTLVSHDHHLTQTDVPSQTGEQFRVVLDSGYRSDLSTDIPDDVDVSTTVLSSQVIDAATTISVEHGGATGINSVDVVCVGFTLEAPPADPPPAAEVPAEEPAEQEPEVVPTPDPVEPVDPVVEVDPVVDDDPPIQDIGEPVGIVRDPAPVTQVESAEVTNDQVPLLAITGPNTTTLALVGIAFGLLCAGAVLLQRESQLSNGR